MTEMKDSGFAFIGQIPENWTILRIKHAAWLKGRIGWDGLKAEEFTDKGPYLITGTDFDNGAVNWETCVHISDERFEEDQLLHIKEGDLLITKDGTVGKVAIVKGCPEKVSLNSGIMIIRNYTKYKYLDKYMYYTLMSNVFTDWFNYNTKPGTTILHLYQHDFDNFKFLLPPLEEQQQIVSYLDVRCSKIDGAIAQRKAIIEKLKDYKSAVITKAVTKGLNPNVEMKDSGVKFIKNIPNKWNVKRLKFILSKKLRYGASESGVEYNSNLPRYIRITDIDENGCLKNEGKLSLTEEAAKNYILEEDCILLARSGATVGKTFLYTMEMPRSAFAGYLIQAIPNGDEITPKFFMYYTNSNPYWMWIGYIFEQATIMNVSAEKYQNLYVCYPSVSEQNDIVAYLDSQCAKIDEAIEKQEQAVAKLEEYRKSIIYYAVTGKIDCRDI